MKRAAAAIGLAVSIGMGSCSGETTYSANESITETTTSVEAPPTKEHVEEMLGKLAAEREAFEANVRSGKLDAIVTLLVCTAVQDTKTKEIALLSNPAMMLVETKDGKHFASQFAGFNRPTGRFYYGSPSLVESNGDLSFDREPENALTDDFIEKDVIEGIDFYSIVNVNSDPTYNNQFIEPTVKKRVAYATKITDPADREFSMFAGSEAALEACHKMLDYPQTTLDSNAEPRKVSTLDS